MGRNSTARRFPEEIRGWGLFNKIAAYFGKELPVAISEDTLDYVDALIVDRLARLAKRSQ